MNVGRAYAIVRGRMKGNTEQAQGLLDNTNPAKLKEMNRQNSRAQGAKRKKMAYKLGEKLRRRK